MSAIASPATEVIAAIKPIGFVAHCRESHVANLMSGVFVYTGTPPGNMTGLFCKSQNRAFNFFQKFMSIPFEVSGRVRTPLYPAGDARQFKKKEESNV